MADIQNASLTIEDVPGNSAIARVTVRYTVFQFPPEFWANTLYEEDIRLIGDDFPFNPSAPSGTDITIAVFPPLSVRNPHGGILPPPPPRFFFDRQRVLYVAKDALNEDPGFNALGLPLQDEVFALISLRYIANVPFPFQLGTIAATAQTNLVTGRW